MLVSVRPRASLCRRGIRSPSILEGTTMTRRPSSNAADIMEIATLISGRQDTIRLGGPGGRALLRILAPLRKGQIHG